MRKLSLIAITASMLSLNAYAGETITGTSVHFPADGFVYKAGSDESCFIKFGDIGYAVASSNENVLVQVIHLDNAEGGRCVSGEKIVIPTVNFERYEAAYEQRIADESRRAETATKLLERGRTL